MNRTLCIGLVMMASSGLAQTTPKIGELYDRLIQPSETNAAAPQILEVGNGHSTARDFLVQKFPSLIIDQLPSDFRTAGKVWLNVVRLSGQLKMMECVPALKQALTTRPAMFGGYDFKYRGFSTFTIESRLAYDIVGRSLADIGDPSIPAVTDILSNGDLPARRRAYWILSNIDTPAAEKAMRDHLPSETDPGVKGMIERKLHISQ